MFSSSEFSYLVIKPDKAESSSRQNIKLPKPSACVVRWLTMAVTWAKECSQVNDKEAIMKGTMKYYNPSGYEGQRSKV